MVNNYLIYISITATMLIGLFLTIFNNIDLNFSELFYEVGQGFIYENNWLVRGAFTVVPALTKLLITFCIVNLILQSASDSNPGVLKRIATSWSCYLVVSALIGPGLIVNYIFKENFGRARPSQISYFHGTKNFTQAFVMTDQCTSNCSFSSGHAAMAYYFSALAYTSALLKRNKPIKNADKSSNDYNYFTIIYVTALLFGSAVGFSRILMGGHFLSDVVISGSLVLIINHLLFIWWTKQN